MEGNTSDPWYWADFLAECDYWVCHFCSETVSAEEGDFITLDHQEVFGCLPCLENYYWKLDPPG